MERINPNDIVGIEVNYFKVLSFHHKKQRIKKNGTKDSFRYYYLCECRCGTLKIIERSHLQRGDIYSCGCTRNKKLSTECFKHGFSGDRLYGIWNNMKNRCNNPNIKKYETYGGRGISVCKDWENSFLNFYIWSMNNGYNKDLTIDRIDVNGNYEPNNCRWVTNKEQARNTRRNRVLTYNNETHCVSEWAEIKNIKPSTLLRRLDLGWSIEKALNTPVSK